MIDDRHWVYKHWGQSATPLYVGCTKSLSNRHSWHKNRSPWFGDIRFIEIEEFEHYGLASDHETAEIVRLCPLHNKRDNPRYGRGPRPVQRRSAAQDMLDENREEFARLMRGDFTDAEIAVLAEFEGLPVEPDPPLEIEDNTE